MCNDNDLIGKILNRRYAIKKKISAGGFGSTYEATDLTTTRTVVVKCLHSTNSPDPLEAERLFQHEVTILGILGNDPRIPTLIDSFEEEGEYYIIQEFIDGKTIAEEVQAISSIVDFRTKERRIFTLIKDILEILDFVHNTEGENQASFIHRDIHPANVMRRVTPQGTRGPIVLIDFGGAKIIETNSGDYTTKIIGKVGYIAPEQLHGKPKHCSDIFAVGMIAFQALTGKNPSDYFELTPDDLKNQYKLPRNARTGKIDWRKLGLESNSNINLPYRNLPNIISKMTYLEPEKRYKNVSEVIRDLDFLVNPRLPKKYIGNSSPFTPLKFYLEQQDFKEADRETARLLIKCANAERNGFLEIEDIARLSSEYLVTINKLWLRFSDGKFGFSTQYNIWQEISNELKTDDQKRIYEVFKERLGWNLKGLKNFTINAPAGHLPIGIVGINWLTLIRKYCEGFGLQKTIAFVDRFEKEDMRHEI